MKGPQIFLGKLAANNGIPADCFVCNPTDSDVRLAKSNLDKTIIARLDGIHVIKATPRNLLAVFRQQFAPLSSVTPNLNALNFEIPLASTLINAFRNRANAKLLKLSHGVVYQSQISKYLHESVLPRTTLPTTVIYNGTDTSHFSPIVSPPVHRHELWAGISANPFRPFKRLHHAIDIINHLNKRGLNTKLLVLGNIDHATVSTIKNRNLSNCQFFEHISNRELPSFLRQLDVFLFPSFMDPCPNSTIEALSCGIPVVASSTCGIAEIINQHTNTWCVNETIPPLPLELCCELGIPEICVNAWADRIEAIYRNITSSKAIARNIATSSLDIRITAKKYREFIQPIADKRNR